MNYNCIVSDEEESECINLLQHTQNSAEILDLMRRTAANRHAWIRSHKANVDEILTRYPHLLDPDIVSL